MAWGVVLSGDFLPCEWQEGARLVRQGGITSDTACEAQQSLQNVQRLHKVFTLALHQWCMKGYLGCASHFC